MVRQVLRHRSTRLVNNKFNENYVNKLTDYYGKIIKEYKESTNKLIYFSMTGFGTFLYIIKQDIDRRFETIDRRFETIDRRFETIDKRFEEIKQDNKIFKEDNKIFKDDITKLLSRKWW